MHYVLYAITLLISSSLLFLVQPMVAKMIQPVLGGTPAVWNTSMVFFQALLLGGYLYAHLSTRWLGTRKQAIIHLVIMVIGLAFLPVAFGSPSDPAGLESPAFWLLTTLFIGVGWPFFVISTSAPLLQKWFSTIDHPRAADPYHLYAASNVGSVLALLAYPFVVEPLIGLQAQATLWAVAYFILIASVGTCAVILWKSPPPPKGKVDSEAPPASIIPVTWRRRSRWVIWAFIPSSMMLAVTTFITTDIAPVPLLWILPLAVFLISFILVFARKKLVPEEVWWAFFPPALLTLMVYFLVEPGLPLWAGTSLHFGAFLVFCMVFHGLLAADRPHTDSLTEFYLWMSVGGVLGGAFTALAAPLLFDQLLEYPLLLVLAAFFFPAKFYQQRIVRLTLLGYFVVGIVTIIYQLFPADTLAGNIALFALPAGAMVATALTVGFRPQRINVLLATLAVMVSASYAWPGPDDLYQERSFFAVHNVRTDNDGEYHMLFHGTTVHGIQGRTEELLDIPLAYFYPLSPIGEIFDILNEEASGHPIGLVGLGMGSIVSYSQGDRPWDIFEIDPAVHRIAANPDLFSYLDNCGNHCNVIMGDGRLQLDAVEDDRYELIILDAYASSAIPVHLLTREAIEIYLSKLRPDGIIAFHISNRHLDLEPPLTQAAHDLGLATRVRVDRLGEDNPYHDKRASPSTWLIMAHTPEALRDIADDPGWIKVEPRQGVRTWTDDYANILSTLRF